MKKFLASALSLLLSLALCVSLLPARAEGKDWAHIFRDPDTRLYGLRDSEDFSILLHAEYDGIKNFREGTTIVLKNTEAYGATYGLVDYNGKFILPMEYGELSRRDDSDDSDNILRARKRGENFYRYLRPDGTPLTDDTFTMCSDFCRNIGVGCRNIGGKELYGAINDKGEVLIPFEYDLLDSPSPSYYGFDWLSAEKDGLFGAFDYNGGLLRRCIYPEHGLLLESLFLPAQMTEEEERGHLISSAQSWEIAHYPNGFSPELWGYTFQSRTALGGTGWAILPRFRSAQPFDETGHAQVTDQDGREGTIDTSGNFTPAEGSGESDAYLITITTDDGVVTSGYRTEWRWVALTRSDPGRPGILLRGSDPNVTGSLRRSDGLTVGDELDAWGKSQDGKPATLALGKESWECTARYKDYGYESVLYVEFLPRKADGTYHQPDSDTLNLFRHDWAQKAADKYAAAMDSLTKEERDDPYEEFSETREIVQTLETGRCTVALTKGKFVSYDDYALFLVYKPYAAMGDGTVKQLILPSTVYDKVHAWYKPTDRAPDSLSVSEDGDTLTYVYHFDEALRTGSGVYHEAGTYTYRVALATGELSVTHTDDVPAPPAEPGAGGFTDVDAADWFAPYVDVCVKAGLMNGVGEGRFDPQGTVTLAQAVTLAARIHNIKNGGDGVLPQAPEDYGTVTLEFENGVRLRFDSAECGTTISPMSLGHLVANLSEEKMAAIEWLGAWESARATVWTVLPEPSGPFPCEAYRQSGSDPDRDVLVLYPSPDGTPEEREIVDNLVSQLMKAHRRPLPGDWFRDTVYYLEKEKLTGPLALRPSKPAKTATRGDFVEALHATSADLLTPKLNDISDFPDAGTEYDAKELADMVLDFYNAGVMTGKDSKGTFDGSGTLTRAEAAAIVARIIDKSLRVTAEP